MPLLRQSPAFSRVTALASLRPIHTAFAWLHGNPKRIMDWQAEVVAIPAPPFGEQARSEWLAARFAEAGLSRVETDAVGNVFGWLPAAHLPAESSGPVVMLSAHLDTVFPAGVPLRPVVNGDRLEAPGACDNCAGIAGMLALAHALRLAFTDEIGDGRIQGVTLTRDIEVIAAVGDGMIGRPAPGGIEATPHGTTTSMHGAQDTACCERLPSSNPATWPRPRRPTTRMWHRSLRTAPMRTTRWRGTSSRSGPTRQLSPTRKATSC
jgi:hypothetical protein